MPRSKREIIRERRRRRQMRGRIIIIVLVAAGALLVGGLLISIGGGIFKPDNVDASVTPISPRTFSVPVDKNTVGKPDAPVKIDVWEDFRCSACIYYSQTIEPLVFQVYVETGKVFYTYHFYPFFDGGDVNGESHQAANAAMCAADQGRFWDYHDILLANSSEAAGVFTDERLLAFARALDLNIKDFKSCLNSRPYADQIEQDLETGAQWGVKGTPSVFVNGVILKPGYVPSFEDISQAVEAAIAGGNP